MTVGYTVNPDDYNENLGVFTLRRDRVPPKENRVKKLGFLAARPPKYRSIADEYQDLFRREKKRQMSMVLEKSTTRTPTRKRKRDDNEQRGKNI